MKNTTIFLLGNLTKKKIIVGAIFILVFLFATFNFFTLKEVFALGSISLSQGGCSGSNRIINIGYAVPAESVSNQWKIEWRIDGGSWMQRHVFSGSTTSAISGSVAVAPEGGHNIDARLLRSGSQQDLKSIHADVCTSPPPPPPPSCTCDPSWTNGSCGGGGCSSAQRNQTRSCTPSGCDTQSRCIADSSCSSPDCSACTLWVNRGCGGAGCASGDIGFTRDCPAGCQEWKCVRDTSCGTACTCNWVNGNCGDGCAVNQRKQTKSCNPAGCESPASRCIADSSCGPPPPPSNCNTGYGAGVLSPDQKLYVWNQLISALPENIANIFYWQVIPQESSWDASDETPCTNCYGVGLYQLEDNTRTGLRGGTYCGEYHKNINWMCQTPEAIRVYNTRGTGYWSSWP